MSGSGGSHRILLLALDSSVDTWTGEDPHSVCGGGQTCVQSQLDDKVFPRHGVPDQLQQPWDSLPASGTTPRSAGQTATPPGSNNINSIRSSSNETSSSSTDPSLVSNWTDADLWAENEAIARKLVPAMVFVGALMLVGIVGNSLVVYVYAWRVKPTTQYFLILCLACSDLLICLIPMPTEIADMRYHLTFSSPEACRLLRFINLLSFVFSIFILLVIAVDRYRRVCRPIGRQMTLREARWGAVVSAVMALVMAWPMLVLTGLRTTITRLPGLYGRDCSFSDDFHNTPYPLALNVALGVGFLIMTFTLAVLYFHIWYHARGIRPFASRDHDHQIPPRTASTAAAATTPVPRHGDWQSRFCLHLAEDLKSEPTPTSTSTSEYERQSGGQDDHRSLHRDSGLRLQFPALPDHNVPEILDGRLRLQQARHGGCERLQHLPAVLLHQLRRQPHHLRRSQRALPERVSRDL
ncbi:oxytocin receptor-like [Pomacea canaliculata]|uniref:oxytocin receptor-like n=1 Tax=Pomacea canaliculata TaxID=400727 RepID=UPI000D73BA2E|nr:oxytocin receptor-like [Pomacea canaliculata]